MHVLITGGTGFIGCALGRRFLARGDRVTIVSRNPARATRLFEDQVAAVGDPLTVAEPVDLAINLAGRNIGRERWNPARKRDFIESRLRVTERLVAAVRAAPSPPKLLLSGSAVGYYGARGDETLDEEAGPADEYQSHLCQAWEAAARKAGDRTRVCLLRFGMVLGPHGGPLAGLLPPFRLGLGGHLGDGRQWLSWIHINDVFGLVEHLVSRDDLVGPINVTAPQPETNREFARKLATVLRRPAVVRIPAWAVRLAMGEMAHLMLTGQRVLPNRALASGYRYLYPELEGALHDTLTGQAA